MLPEYSKYNNGQLATELLELAQSPTIPLGVARLMTASAERIKELSLTATPVQLPLF
jgi:hypothetical protein